MMKNYRTKQSVELFAGSGSVSKIFQTYHYQTFTVDNNPLCRPDLCIDILSLKPSMLPPHIDLLWASPLCQFFSRLADPLNWNKKTLSYRNFDYIPLSPGAHVSVGLINKTFEIINHFNPAIWFIENPIGRIHHTQAMRLNGHHRYFVNYADFGFPYSKETYIFTNQFLPLPQKRKYARTSGFQTLKDKNQRPRIPDQLIYFLLNSCPGT